MRRDLRDIPACADRRHRRHLGRNSDPPVDGRGFRPRGGRKRDGGSRAAQRTNPSTRCAQFDAAWVQWWDSQAGTPPGQEPWHASDRLSWKPVPQVDYWDAWGPEWKNFDGRGLVSRAASR